jgi:hypothetical protein
MAYEIRYLGGDIEECKDREDAMWHLGAVYGAQEHNRGVDINAITYTDEYVLVRPHLLTIPSSYSDQFKR